jgi:nucleoside-diphosphate-sugar epimerase
MVKEKILVIGASGQIGVELTMALRKLYGNANVIASDLETKSSGRNRSLCFPGCDE